MNYYDYINGEKTSPNVAMDGTVREVKKILGESLPNKVRLRRGRILIEQIPKEISNNIIRANVALIKTIPSDFHDRIVAYIKKVFSGQRTHEELINYLARIGDVTEDRARMIADDQIAKATEKFLVEKWKGQGVKWVRWVHRGATEPRKFHIENWDRHSGKRDGKPNGLNGFVFPIDKPPIIDKKTGERGYPGQLVNCHCHLEPIRLSGTRNRLERKRSKQNRR